MLIPTSSAKCRATNCGNDSHGLARARVGRGAEGATGLKTRFWACFGPGAGTVRDPSAARPTTPPPAPSRTLRLAQGKLGTQPRVRRAKQMLRIVGWPRWALASVLHQHPVYRRFNIQHVLAEGDITPELVKSTTITADEDRVEAFRWALNEVTPMARGLLLAKGVDPDGTTHEEERIVVTNVDALNALAALMVGGNGHAAEGRGSPGAADKTPEWLRQGATILAASGQQGDAPPQHRTTRSRSDRVPAATPLDPPTPAPAPDDDAGPPGARQGAPPAASAARPGPRGRPAACGPPPPAPAPRHPPRHRRRRPPRSPAARRGTAAAARRGPRRPPRHRRRRPPRSPRRPPRHRRRRPPRSPRRPPRHRRRRPPRSPAARRGTAAAARRGPRRPPRPPPPAPAPPPPPAPEAAEAPPAPAAPGDDDDGAGWRRRPPGRPRGTKLLCNRGEVQVELYGAYPPLLLWALAPQNVEVPHTAGVVRIFEHARRVRVGAWYVDTRRRREQRVLHPLLARADGVGPLRQGPQAGQVPAPCAPAGRAAALTVAPSPRLHRRVRCRRSILAPRLFGRAPAPAHEQPAH